MLQRQLTVQKAQTRNRKGITRTCFAFWKLSVMTTWGKAQVTGTSTHPSSWSLGHVSPASPDRFLKLPKVNVCRWFVVLHSGCTWNDLVCRRLKFAHMEKQLGLKLSQISIISKYQAVIPRNSSKHSKSKCVGSVGRLMNPPTSDRITGRRCYM